MKNKFIIVLAAGLLFNFSLPNNCWVIIAAGAEGPSFSGSYLAGKALLLARADLVLDNQLAAGSYYRIGLGGAAGTDNDNHSLKAILMFFDGIFHFPRKASWGGKNYAGAGFNYVLYGTDRKAGAFGYRFFTGSEGDAGFGGITFMEIGYTLVRSGDINKRSAEGIEIVLGQKINL